MKLASIAAAAFIICWFLSAIASTVSAAPNSGLEITPAYLEVTLADPLETQKITLKITNNTGKPLRLQMYPIDFKQTDDNGTVGFVGQEAGSYSYSLSSFLSFEADSISLEPDEVRTFSVTVQNREDLSPGGHYAAIVGRIEPEGGKSGAVVSPAISSLILLRKSGGERFNLSLKEVGWPNGSVVFGYPLQVQLLFQNEGNVHLIPYGRAEITDIFGRLIYKGVINPGSLAVLPESRRYLYADLDTVEQSMPVSVNTLSISGKDSLGKVPYVSRETFVYIDPVFTDGALVFIAGAVFLRMKLRRRSRS